MEEWSRSTDRDDYEGPQHQPVPPTPEQEAAANALFEKTLSTKDLPTSFERDPGEGLDRITDFGEGLDKLLGNDDPA